ncbi:replication initiation protein, partial [Streptococcus pluranimalium]
MANEVVKYHNKLNTISMRKWTAEEMNFFFSVIAKVRDKGTRLISFDSDELKELSGFADNHEHRWVTTMDNVADKALNLRYSEERDSKRIRMNLFTYFEVDRAERTVEVEVSSKFEYVVNQLEAQFTQYELAEFTEIRSTYAKTMYRLIKQWRTVGKKEFQISEFRDLLEIPKSYTNGEISRRVLEPIEKELANYFLGFKCKIIKSNKRGNPVTGYLFSWKP